MTEPIVDSFFLIFTGSAVLATAALVGRQSMLVSYILLGMLLGPWGLGVVHRVDVISAISHVGVVFLLFLLGLNLHPQKLMRMLGETVTVTVASTLLFGCIGFAVAWGFGFTVVESLVIAAGSTFSSTIIGLKLLPTTALHQQHTGEVIISILLLQDLIAILVLLFLQGMGGEAGALWWELGLLAVALPALVGIAFLGARYLLMPLFMRFDTIHEYVFLVAIGWCLGIAELGVAFNLSAEIGAFIAGVAVATHPISTFIAESLKPLRDFFLVLFFFSLGATFDLTMVYAVAVPAVVLAGVLLVVKPLALRFLLRRGGEGPRISQEVGVRIGQMSEFALFIAVLAREVEVVGEEAAYLLQLATLLTFVASSYYIMLRYPTPIAVNDRLRRD